MKKIIFSLAFISLLVACGSNASNENKEPKKEDPPKQEENSGGEVSSNPDYQKGLGLIAKSDCLTCHKVDEPLTGPSYRDVANKYGALPDTIIGHLADKIIKGGSGQWGPVIMTPHPGISKDDATAMVKYIMLLKK